jgi:hypothetical protein
MHCSTLAPQQPDSRLTVRQFGVQWQGDGDLLEVVGYYLGLHG